MCVLNIIVNGCDYLSVMVFHLIWKEWLPCMILRYWCQYMFYMLDTELVEARTWLYHHNSDSLIAVVDMGYHIGYILFHTDVDIFFIALFQFHVNYLNERGSVSNTAIYLKLLKATCIHVTVFKIQCNIACVGGRQHSSWHILIYRHYFI